MSVKPSSPPREVLLSLTKKELVDWILSQHPLEPRQTAREAYCFALERRYRRIDKQWGEVLSRREMKGSDKYMRQTDALLKEMDIWGSF